ncbi:MAG: Fe-only nitrogenase accessory AnfO family protein [Desulfovibrio sp.]
MQGLLDGSRIAVFHDDLGALAAPTAASAVAVYVRGERDWSEDKRHSFSLPGGAGLSELREQMHALAANLGDCRIVVGAEDHGAPYGVLDKLGFYICMMDRFEAEALEGVRKGVLAAVQQATRPQCGMLPTSRPREIAPGRFFLDMCEAKITDPLFTARESILVFVETTPFEQLQIKCDHEPRWLPSFALVTGLEMEKEELESGLMLVTVRQPADRNADALLGQKWFDGTGCSCG